MTVKHGFVELSIALLLLVAVLSQYWTPWAWLLKESTIPADWKSAWDGADADHWQRPPGMANG